MAGSSRIFRARDLSARVLRKASGLVGRPPILESIANAVDARIHVEDPFTRWLMLANAGMMDPGNLHCFQHALQRLPSDAPVLEIGAFCGLSTNLLAHFKRLAGRRNRIISCDPWMFEGSGGPEERMDQSIISYGQFRTLVMDSFKRNVSTFSGDDLPFSVEKTSDAFFAAWQRADTVKDLFGRDLTLGGPLSMCFVDGNHTYEFARRDIQNADAHLQPGGFLFLDDSADGSDWGVCQARDELRARPDYELVMANPNYLFRKVR